MPAPSVKPSGVKIVGVRISYLPSIIKSPIPFPLKLITVLELSKFDQTVVFLLFTTYPLEIKIDTFSESPYSISKLKDATDDVLLSGSSIFFIPLKVKFRDVGTKSTPNSKFPLLANPFSRPQKVLESAVQ